jgi:hypothetical protein
MPQHSRTALCAPRVVTSCELRTSGFARSQMRGPSFRSRTMIVSCLIAQTGREGVVAGDGTTLRESAEEKSVPGVLIDSSDCVLG